MGFSVALSTFLNNFIAFIILLYCDAGEAAEQSLKITDIWLYQLDDNDLSNCIIHIIHLYSLNTERYIDGWGTIKVWMGNNDESPQTKM